MECENRAGVGTTRGQPVNPFIRVALTVLTIVLVSAPLSVVATLLLFPFWSWFEATTGIESVGHSGPAEWCYVVAFVFLVAGGVLVLFGRRLRKQNGSDGA